MSPSSRRLVSSSSGRRNAPACGGTAHAQLETFVRAVRGAGRGDPAQPEPSRAERHSRRRQSDGSRTGRMGSPHRRLSRRARARFRAPRPQRAYRLPRGARRRVSPAGPRRRRAAGIRCRRGTPAPSASARAGAASAHPRGRTGRSEEAGKRRSNRHMDSESARDAVKAYYVFQRPGAGGSRSVTGRSR